MYGEIGYLSVPSVETLERPMEDGYMMLHSRHLVMRLPTSVSILRLQNKDIFADGQVTILLLVSCTPLAPVSLLPPMSRSDAHRFHTSS